MDRDVQLLNGVKYREDECHHKGAQRALSNPELWA